MQGRHDLEGMMRDGRSSPGSCRYRRRHSAPCRPRRATPRGPPRAGPAAGRDAAASRGGVGCPAAPRNEKRVGKVPSREAPDSPL